MNQPNPSGVTKVKLYVLDHTNPSGAEAAAYMAEADPSDKHVLQYVLATDFDALAAERDQLKAQRDGLLEALKYLLRGATTDAGVDYTTDAVIGARTRITEASK